jgi:hypothetical protein
MANIGRNEIIADNSDADTEMAKMQLTRQKSYGTGGRNQIMC